MTAREFMKSWVRDPRPVEHGKFRSADGRTLRALGEPLLTISDRPPGANRPRSAWVETRGSVEEWTRTQERYARIACQVLDEAGFVVFRSRS